MKRAGLVITIVFALLALACGFAGTTAALYITQPSVASSSVVVQFVVNQGDTTASVADHLQQAGLIRNALAFRVWSRYRHLDRGIEPGVYKLSPDMTMDAIVLKLQKGEPEEQFVTIPDGWRVTQYPAALAVLANFDAKNFLQIAKTGKFADGTSVSSKYWFVRPKQSKAVYALEGYLFADSYYFDKNADEQTVITTMLNTFGEKLCPGPTDKPDAYMNDQAQCKAHAVTVGKKNVNIFTALEQKYGTSDDVVALYDALTIASIVEREVSSRPKDFQGVADVYYNRFLVVAGKLQGDVGLLLQADPTTQYARDTDSPPQDGKWWAPLNDKPANIDPRNAYNTYVATGLPPGPISAPLWDIFLAAADPNPDGPTPYFYFLSDDCGNTHYAKTNDEFSQMTTKYIGTGVCTP